MRSECAPAMQVGFSSCEGQHQRQQQRLRLRCATRRSSQERLHSAGHGLTSWNVGLRGLLPCHPPAVPAGNWEEFQALTEAAEVLFDAGQTDVYTLK